MAQARVVNRLQNEFLLLARSINTTRRHPRESRSKRSQYLPQKLRQVFVSIRKHSLRHGELRARNVFE